MCGLTKLYSRNYTLTSLKRFTKVWFENPILFCLFSFSIYLACKEDLGPCLSSSARSSNCCLHNFWEWLMKRELEAYFKPLRYSKILQNISGFQDISRCVCQTTTNAKCYKENPQLKTILLQKVFKPFIQFPQKASHSQFSAPSGNIRQKVLKLQRWICMISNLKLFIQIT